MRHHSINVEGLKLINTLIKDHSFYGSTRPYNKNFPNIQPNCCSIIMNERSVTRLNLCVSLMIKFVNVFLNAWFTMYFLFYWVCLGWGKILTVKMNPWYQMWTSARSDWSGVKYLSNNVLELSWNKDIQQKKFLLK